MDGRDRAELVDGPTVIHSAGQGTRSGFMTVIPTARRYARYGG